MTKTSTSVDGEDGQKVDKGDETVYGRACIAYDPQTWYYGTFPHTSIEVTETTTTTTTYQGRVARHDKKVTSHTVVTESDFRVTAGTLYCYTRRVRGPIQFDAPYPS